MTFLLEPLKIAPERDEVSIHGGDGTLLISSQCISEVGEITNRDSFRDESFTVLCCEPAGELPHVVRERSASVDGEVVTVEEAFKQGFRRRTSRHCSCCSVV